MEIEFADKKLDRLEVDPDFNGGFDLGIVKAYRDRIRLIRQAVDERDFYALKSLHYEKLKGNRQHQRSMRLNRQWRLIVEIDEVGSVKIVVVCRIEDYH